MYNTPKIREDLTAELKRIEEELVSLPADDFAREAYRTVLCDMTSSDMFDRELSASVMSRISRTLGTIDRYIALHCTSMQDEEVRKLLAFGNRLFVVAASMHEMSAESGHISERLANHINS